jgi:hypothetical protein
MMKKIQNQSNLFPIDYFHIVFVFDDDDGGGDDDDDDVDGLACLLP